jgi:replicative DNA helicase
MISQYQEAESNIIGFCLLNKSGLDEVLSHGVKTHHFCHREVFEAICAASKDFGVNDYLTVSSKVPGEKEFMLNAQASAPLHIKSSCVVLILESTRQRVREKLLEAASMAVEANDPVSEAVKAVNSISGEGSGVSSPSSFGEIVGGIYDSMDDRPQAVCSFGIRSLDMVLGNLMRGEMSVLAGKPGSGKTTLGVQCLLNCAESGKHALFVSAEMTKESVVSRIVQQKSGVNLRRIRQGLVINDAEKPLLSNAMGRVSEIPAAVYDFKGRDGRLKAKTPSAVRSAVIQMQKAGKCPELVVIDFLTLFKSDDRIDNRVQELDQITQDFRDLSKEFDCHVMVLSQVSREGQKQEELDTHHLRDSGAIEANANQVITVWDTGEKTTYGSKKMKIKVAKNRDYQTGTVDAVFVGECYKFTE